MEYYRNESDAFIRLEPGDFLMKSLMEFAKLENIDFAIISSGVGMLEGIEMGWFCVNNNDYDKYTIAGTYDLSSISGNISLFNGNPHPHIHIVANHPDFETLSGHLIDCRCHITMEIGLRIFDNEALTRKTKEGVPASFITKK
ncbi:DNA-binding protein [Seonamhaeicola sp. MEBiC1930]|uniref:PPC domain-containing DNA-binding protein n=1 Tax=Seonamhaeicola sp. MEBiC01930 TaxID=2976768 RepID=UPI003247D8FF